MDFSFLVWVEMMDFFFWVKVTHDVSLWVSVVLGCEISLSLLLF